MFVGSSLRKTWKGEFWGSCFQFILLEAALLSKWTNHLTHSGLKEVLWHMHWKFWTFFGWKTDCEVTQCYFHCTGFFTSRISRIFNWEFRTVLKCKCHIHSVSVSNDKMAASRFLPCPFFSIWCQTGTESNGDMWHIISNFYSILISLQRITRTQAVSRLNANDVLYKSRLQHGKGVNRLWQEGSLFTLYK